MQRDGRRETFLSRGHLPDLLPIVLKRFVFNFDTQEAVKLQNRVEFPDILDVEPFTMDTDIEASNEASNGASNGASEGGASNGVEPSLDAPLPSSFGRSRSSSSLGGREGGKEGGKRDGDGDGDGGIDGDGDGEPGKGGGGNGNSCKPILRNTKYALKGVLVHAGDARGGHYYSLICDRATGEWYRFDDKKVREKRDVCCAVLCCAVLCCVLCVV